MCLTNNIVLNIVAQRCAINVGRARAHGVLLTVFE